MSLQTIDALKSLISKMTGENVKDIMIKTIPEAIDVITDAFEEGGGSGDGAPTICTFHHEPTYVACVGAEFSIYFDNICKTKNNANIYFGATSSNAKISISVLEDCLRITPDNKMIGTSTITVKAIRKDTGTKIAETTFTLRVIGKTALSRSVRVMLIGDSITNGGWNYDLPNMMNVTFYGTLGASPRNHEGRVSWKASDYCTKASYNNMTNPFYNANKAGPIKFDFAYYMQNHASFSDVDYVNIMLGRNDGYATSCIPYIKAMVDDILSYNENIRITVSFAYHKGYQIWEKDRYLFSYTARVKTFEFDAEMHNTFDGYDRVDLIPTFVNSDNVYDHGINNKSISYRNTTFQYPVFVADGTHFTTQGYRKIGDVYYNYLNNLISIYPLPEDTPSGVNRSALSTSLTTANELLSNTTISADGADVASSRYWCSESDHNAFSSAISAAQSVYDADATQSDVDTAVSTLNTAITTFNGVRQLGSATVTPTRPDSGLYYYWLHNITTDKYYYVSNSWGIDDNYYPTKWEIIKNGSTYKTYIKVTMGGTAQAMRWKVCTSDDGVAYSKPVEQSGTQWEITSFLAHTDEYEILGRGVKNT